MQKKSYLLTGLCICALLGLLSLQVYWIKKYYSVTTFIFEKEVNMAFEDALKKEFSNRADSIEQLLKSRLLDTSAFIISGDFDKRVNSFVYSIRSTNDPSDHYSSSASFRDFKKPLKKNDTAFRNQIAEKFAQVLRSEDLENHFVYYRTQALGKYMVDLTEKIEFDTAKLRPILNKYLSKRNIHVSYRFYTKDSDSTTNSSTFTPALLKEYPVITRSLPTYRTHPGQNYVRVMFTNPFPYILSNMWLILVSSFVLITLIAGCIYFLLTRLRKEKRLSAIKNDFISNITHEFKTPIATATVAVEALSDRTVLQDEEKTTRYLAHAKNELSRISMLTDKILKLSLYEANNLILKKEILDIAETVNEVVKIYALSAPLVSIQFFNNSGVAQLNADRIQFQHAISNIIENAIKYGTDPIQIFIRCSLMKEHVVLSIKDNGPGIPEAEMAMVFEKFYRVKRPENAQIKGYGLGLNYVKQIMQQHAGWYKITSDGNGTELDLGWPI
jgi:signal transduction histidine kinase